MPLAPSLFVSSTCYDLRQVRADLEQFIRTLGLNPILSETLDFPVAPESGTIENCLRVVDEQADLFLLIIGNRYGSIDRSGKSVTNLEYIRARAKGIPIYVFVAKQILHNLPVWRSTPDADFSSVADSPRVFEFVSLIRESDNLWVFPFELVQEIQECLRAQLGTLFGEALALRRRVKAAAIPNSLSGLQGRALRLILDRPRCWEYLLFAAVLSDGIEASRSLKLDLSNKLLLGVSGRFVGSTILSHVPKVFADFQRMLTDLGILLGRTIGEAFGPPGVSGNPEKIVYTARKVAELYRAAIAWSIECYRYEVDSEYRRFIELLTEVPADVISQIESFPGRVEKACEEMIQAGGGNQQLVLTVGPLDLKELSRERERLFSLLKRGELR
jgi:hypothetical protein